MGKIEIRNLLVSEASLTLIVIYVKIKKQAKDL